MKRLFQTATLLGALLLGQPALAQDSTQALIKDSKQEVSQDKQKNQFYIPRFSREKIIQQLPYRNRAEQDLNYVTQNNPESYNELRELIRDEPILNTFYKISRDKEPFQLYNGWMGITFSPSRKKYSPVNGLIRQMIKILKSNLKKPLNRIGI